MGREGWKGKERVGNRGEREGEGREWVWRDGKGKEGMERGGMVRGGMERKRMRG